MIYQGWKPSFPAFFLCSAAANLLQAKPARKDAAGYVSKSASVPNLRPFGNLVRTASVVFRLRYAALISDAAAMAPMTQLAAMIAMRRGVFAPLRMSRSRASDLQPM